MINLDSQLGSQLNKEQKRAYSLEKTYGITLEQYSQMFEEQKGCCAICNRHQSEFKRALHVDHDHSTGEVRGLLCGNCNTAIGLLDESLQLFDKAQQYLKNKRGTP